MISSQQQRRERELRKQQEREQRRRYEEMEQLRREEERRHAEREQVGKPLTDQSIKFGKSQKGAGLIVSLTLMFDCSSLITSHENMTGELRTSENIKNSCFSRGVLCKSLKPPAFHHNSL